MLRWRTVSGDARAFVDPVAFQPLPPFQGRPVPVVSKSEFAGTGFTEAHQRDVPVAGWSLASSLASRCAALLEAGEPFVYAYYEGIDKIAHIAGLRRLLRRRAGRRRPAGGRPARRPAGGGGPGRDRRPRPGRGGAPGRLLDPRLADEAAMMSGEARFRWLHARRRRDRRRRPPGRRGPDGLRRRGLGGDPRPDGGRRAGSADRCSRRSGPGWATWPLIPYRAGRLPRPGRRRRRPAGLPARIAHAGGDAGASCRRAGQTGSVMLQRPQTRDRPGPEQVLIVPAPEAGDGGGRRGRRTARRSSSRPR